LDGKVGVCPAGDCVDIMEKASCHGDSLEKMSVFGKHYCVVIVVLCKECSNLSLELIGEVSEAIFLIVAMDDSIMESPDV